jgi:hypothetical protein
VIAASIILGLNGRQVNQVVVEEGDEKESENNNEELWLRKKDLGFEQDVGGDQGELGEHHL